MNKISKKSLNTVLGMFIALNLTGCSLFEASDESKKDDNAKVDEQKKKDDQKKEESKDDDKEEVTKKEEERDSVVVTNNNKTNSYTPTSKPKPSKQPNQNNTVQVIKVDYSILRSTLFNIKSMDLSSYTPESAAKLNNAISNAERVLNDPLSSQSIVNLQIQLLNNAYTNLVKQANFENLNNIIENAKKINSELYTPISVANLLKNIENGKTILNNKNSKQSEVDAIVKKIQDSMNTLVKRADTKNLQATVNKAKNIINDNYTDESLDIMKISLTNAQEILSDLNATQKAVDDIQLTLKDAINNLVEYVKLDITNLKKLISDASKYKENEFSIASFTELKDAIKFANETLAIKKVTATQIENAEVRLSDAINSLTVDTSKLIQKLKVAKEIKELDYTPSTYNPLKTVIADTETFVTTNHKQYEVDQQLLKLETALQKLVKRADKSELKKAIDKALALYTGDFTTNTLDALKQKVEEAQLIYDNQEATVEQVSNMVVGVNQAIANLKVVIHKESLQNAIQNAKGVVENKYTPKTYTIFKKAYDQALVINANEDATQAQVDEICTSLVNATDGLIERANTSQLNTKINVAELLKEDDFTDASFKKMKDELLKSKTVLNDLNSSQADVDQQLTQLTTAIDNLVLYVVPNFNDINTLISNAENVVEENWSTTSYQTLATKLQKAKDIITKHKVTQEEVDLAKEELSIAYNTLSVDKTILNQKLILAKTYQEVNYTLDSFASLTTAINHTETFVNETHTQKEVNQEVQSLTNAINNLIIFTEVNKTELTNMIDVANALDATKYTPNSFAILTKAINDAKAVKDNYRATEIEVSNAIQTINASKLSLILRANLTTINQTIAEAKTKFTGLYTTASLQALKDTVSLAENLILDFNVSQGDIDAKVEDINNAMKSLISLGDKTALASLIQELEALKETDYTPISWASASLGSVLDEAKIIRDKTEATEIEVNTSLDELTNAKAKLVKKADLTDLTNEIAKAEAEQLKGYTSVTLTALQTAIDEAKIVKDDVNATAQQVSLALSKLKNAITSLKIDVSPLLAEIATTKGVDVSNKKPSTVKALNDIISEAELLKDSSTITFETMDTMIQRLKDAVIALKDKVDTSTLVDKLNEAKALNKSDYTEDSYKALDDVMKEVTTALTNEDITLDQMTQLIQKIDSAMENLKYPETVASKRIEGNKLVKDARILLNDTSLQVPDSYRSALKEKSDDLESLLSSFEDKDLSVSEIQGYIDNVKTAMQEFNDNIIDVEAFISKCQAKIAEVCAMDMSGYSESSVASVTYFVNHLEESIQGGKDYAYLQSAYGWLIEELENLAPADTTIYVNEQAPSEVLALLNAERKKLGMGELTMDSELCKATTIRATEAKDQTGVFADWAHKRPDGTKWNTVLDEIDYHQSYAGENAAIGYASGTALYNGWYASQGHKDNMLDSEFTKVGISMIKVGEGQWVSYMILAK